MRISATSAARRTRSISTSVRRRSNSTSPKPKRWNSSWTSSKKTTSGSSRSRRKRQLIYSFMVSVPEISKNIVKLFSIEKKRELEKYCSHLLIASEELVDLIQSSWLIGYVHSSRHKEYQPPEAQLTEDDLEALRSKDPAIRAQKLPKLMNKTDNLFNVRKRLSAHLFLNTSMKWHLFYFSIEDVADCRDNHWKKGGPHV